MGDRVRERETDGGGSDGFRDGRDYDAGAGQRGGSRKLRRTLDEFCSICAFVRALYALPHPPAPPPLLAKRL